MKSQQNIANYVVYLDARGRIVETYANSNLPSSLFSSEEPGYKHRSTGIVQSGAKSGHGASNATEFFPDRSCLLMFSERIQKYVPQNESKALLTSAGFFS